MRKFYFFLITGFIACVLLFVGSFFYLDSQKRNVYHFVVSLKGHDIGTIKIDKFVTEEKRLYKSWSEMPFNPVFDSDKTRMVFDKDYKLETYSYERSGSGASEAIQIENSDNRVSFISIARSKFSYLRDMPIRDMTFVFKEDSPVTYLPLIENYDFRRGKSQGFDAITPFSELYPPMKRFVTLTSIRNEYIKVDRRKIKTECLLLKIRNYPQGTVWVARSDRSIIMIDLPTAGITIRRSFLPKNISAVEYSPDMERASVKDVKFPGKGGELAGTLYMPKIEGKRPAVILVWGDGPEKGAYQGLFSSMAAGLAKEGFIALTFDKRGVGGSGGDPNTTTDTDAVDDIGSAVDFLKAEKDVDPDKIALIGHSKGSFYASRVCSSRDDIKALVFIAPRASLESKQQATDFADLIEMAKRYGWSEDYLKSVMKSQVETLDKARNAKRGRVSLLGKRCFAGKMQEEMSEDPIAVAGKIKAPVLILQGKEDGISLADSAAKIDKALEESGNKDHTLTYFGYLDHFMAASIIDGKHKIHYVTDPSVVDATKKWLDEALAEPPPEAAPVATPAAAAENTT